MNAIVDFIKQQEDYVCLGHASHNEIEFAESQLNLRFSEEYEAYTAALGVTSFGSHELTGICNIPRLNVVDVTNEARKFNTVPFTWYVIEATNIDGILIWQDQVGNVYQTAPGSTSTKIASSMLEYLSDTQA